MCLIIPKQLKKPELGTRRASLSYIVRIYLVLLALDFAAEAFDFAAAWLA